MSESTATEKQDTLVENPESTVNYKEKADQLLREYAGTPEIDQFLESTVDKEKLWMRDRQQIINSLVNECEDACRHALTMQADNLVILDKSARGYGYIIHKIFPMLALEHAKTRGVDPENIQVPKICFFNPTDEFLRGESKDEKGLEMLRNIVSGKKSLIFDEASFKTEANATERTVSKVALQLVKLGGGTTESHVGTSRSSGGWLRTVFLLADIKEAPKSAHPPRLVISDINNDGEEQLFAKCNEEIKPETWRKINDVRKMVVKKIIEDVYQKSFA